MWYYSAQFGIQLSLDIHCAAICRKLRTEFPNVWGEYKYHGNTCIQGMVLPYPVITMQPLLTAAETELEHLIVRLNRLRAYTYSKYLRGK